MTQFIKRLNVVGLYGRFDIEIGFTEDVNIVYGVNGAGKTTMLHMLANAANLDLDRFTQLPFKSVKLEIAEGPAIAITCKPISTREGFQRVSLFIDGILKCDWPPISTHPRQDRGPWFAPHESIEEFKKHHNIEIEATYFPAFRTMREAWSSLDLLDVYRSGIGRSDPLMSRASRTTRRSLGAHRRDPDLRTEDLDLQMALTREIFGEFVPYVNYPSPRDIQRNLDEAIQVAVNRLAIGDRSLLSEAFNRVFQAISHRPEGTVEDSRKPEDIRIAIGELLEHLQSTQSEYGVPGGNSAFDALGPQLALSERPGQGQDDTTTRVFLVYEDALKRRDKNLEDAFATVRAYIYAVNAFLEGKQLAATSTPESGPIPQLRIKHSDGTLSQLDTLSSGERQVVGLIYSASHLAEGNVILVDEPELSLHIDWQQTIIEAMVRQLPSKQLIVCTHSPVIGSEYMDHMIHLEPAPTESPVPQI